MLATDGDLDTVQLLRENISRTEVEVEALQLQWGSDPSGALAYAPEGFDVLLAADVLYEDDQIDPLLQSCCDLLSGKYQRIRLCSLRGVDRAWELLSFFLPSKCARRASPGESRSPRASVGAAGACVGPSDRREWAGAALPPLKKKDRLLRLKTPNYITS